MGLDDEFVDAAFAELVVNHRLDELIEVLEHLGFSIGPGRRELVSEWLDLPDSVPMTVRLLRLSESLRGAVA